MAEVKKVESLVDFDTDLKYSYEMLKRVEDSNNIFNEAGRKVTPPKFKPKLNVLFESSVIWDGSKDPFSGKQRPQGKHYIRFYDGCTTLFKDDQPQQKEVIDTLLLSTDKRYFDYGYIHVDGNDRLLKLYMDWASFNINSPFRNEKIDPIWKSVLGEADVLSEAQKLDLKDKAIEYAKTCKESKMLTHARFLDIPDTDIVTGAKYSPEAVRILYRKFASEKPEVFMKSFNDESVELKQKIKDSIYSGRISLGIIPNQAVWTQSGLPICDISGISENINLVVAKIAEFALSGEGSEFMAKLG